MESFRPYLEAISEGAHRKKMEGLLFWVHDTFPTLGMRIAWNQPMFTDHGTFIIGFSKAKRHISVAPEKKAIDVFSEAIMRAGLSVTKELFRITWEQEIPYSLLMEIINYNREDKKTCTTFWRHEEETLLRTNMKGAAVASDLSYKDIHKSRK
ncbi:MAG: iron chaperone [Sphaerochaetaceae bacterium]